jgi:hypothetical protein
MAVTETRPPNPPNSPGEALVAELKWVHDMIRRDLQTVRQMAADTAAGQPADEIRAGIRSLATSGPLWQLKINCLHYCRLVHSHHGVESMALFPALRRANPELEAVVDKLEADHRSVAALLGDVETAAQALSDGQDPVQRERLTLALRSLSETLLAHLSYEEDQISDTLRTFGGWPW